MRTELRVLSAARCASRFEWAAAAPFRTIVALSALGFSALALALAGSLAAPTGLAAQTLDELAFECRGSTPAQSQALCAPTVAGFLAVGRGLSIAQTGGSPLSGSASTLGKRFATTPRYALAGSFAWSRMNTPDFREASGERNARLLTLDADVAVGLTEGFSPQPTVGGLFAIDLLGTLGVTFVDGAAFDTSPVHWGYGFRLGAFRESFTLPGASLSVMRVHGGGIQGPLYIQGNDRVRIFGGSIDIEGTTTTSVRATVGKEFVALAILGGIGWDRTDVEGSFTVSDRPTAVTVAGLSDDRVSFFGSVSRTWLIAALTLEVQYVRGFDGPSTLDWMEYEPGDGTFRIGLGTRLTF